MTNPALQAFLAAHPDAVLVRLQAAQGSVPREAGAWMLVAADTGFGTIGGGRLEHAAMAAAREMLGTGAAERRLDVALGPESGQCCGGRATVALRRLDPARAADLLRRADPDRPEIHILGAGHVGRALATALAPLPVRTILVDSRADQLDLAPDTAERRLTPLPEAEIRAARPGSAFAVMTHDHGLDFTLTAEALSRGDAAYVGMIGSATKRARLLRHLAAQAPGADASALTCPIGAAGAGDKRPAVIAAFTAAEIMAALNGAERATAGAALAGTG
ncbi:molybdenum cofactor sulfurylase [Rhodovulum sp. ES.010]|uniref:xanthine dehydrogenase accessory protein XdhC n=1 Tax=Rhodovulum sp. ES.010 TaxID=1882821 RepID=UPI00092C58B6|nr:xanthine dehydrogenase accessory protein XdhC [Rhodovulum sp. ES.010]SIO45353.1 molybdenum cofactor sulfurylase [Rhodovulum sp. ES.010]